MLFFGNKQKKLRKQCRQMLGHAHKVVAYRKDVLSEQALEELAENRSRLEEALKAKADSKVLEEACDQLEKSCKKHGGKIYPMSFGSENVEMIIVAAVLAIGVRTYFVQPFKIPTNSMWPTYAGLNATVYPPEDPRPSLPKRVFLGATQGLPQSIFGEFNYFIVSPATGELVIPVMVLQDDMGIQVKTLFKPYQKPRFGKLFTQIQTVRRNYALKVGEATVNIDTMGDFELDDVIVQSWFPEFDDPNKGLNAVYEAYKAAGKVSSSPHRGVEYIHTGKQLNTGDTVLDFNINSGDMLFVDRFSYNFVRPDVGAPFVFRTDNIPGLRKANSIGQLEPDERYYIKRLVGIGGDELEVRGSTLYRNGEPIDGADAFDKNAKQVEGYAGYQSRGRIIDGDTILEGYYYAMGDNSPHSLDSRLMGIQNGEIMDDYLLTSEEKAAGVPVNMVPEHDVIGRAFFIFYPFSHRWGPAE